MNEFTNVEEMLEEVRNDEDYEDMVPVDQWNGECWQTFFEEFCVPNGERYDISPWEYLANFIKHLMEV